MATFTFTDDTEQTGPVDHIEFRLGDQVRHEWDSANQMISTYNTSSSTLNLAVTDFVDSGDKRVLVITVED